MTTTHDADPQGAIDSMLDELESHARANGRDQMTIQLARDPKVAERLTPNIHRRNYEILDIRRQITARLAAHGPSDPSEGERVDG